MHSHEHCHAQSFGPEHAPHYDAGAATALAGYDAMHEVVAATMTSALRGNDAASLLCVGVGTGQELLPYARYGAPAWRFTGVDTSRHMLAVASERLAGAGLLERMRLHAGTLHDLPAGPSFDGAQMVGVLHHVEGEEARLALLREVARRLEPGAPLIIGVRIGADPVLLAAEEERLRVAGVSPEKRALRREELARLEVPTSEEAFFALLLGAGLTEPRQLFASLQFKVFLVRSAPE
jgi:tRNA (cmo5U34)-methyltransferase